MDKEYNPVFRGLRDMIIKILSSTYLCVALPNLLSTNAEFVESVNAMRLKDLTRLLDSNRKAVESSFGNSPDMMKTFTLCQLDLLFQWCHNREQTEGLSQSDVHILSGKPFWNIFNIANYRRRMSEDTFSKMLSNFRWMRQNAFLERFHFMLGNVNDILAVVMEGITPMQTVTLSMVPTTGAGAVPHAPPTTPALNVGNGAPKLGMGGLGSSSGHHTHAGFPPLQKPFQSHSRDSFDDNRSKDGGIAVAEPTGYHGFSDAKDGDGIAPDALGTSI
jgi:hypothetical protein